MEINDNTNSQFKFKTTLLKSSLCNYSDAYILVKETITVVAAGATHMLGKMIKIISKKYLKIAHPLPTA